MGILEQAREARLDRRYPWPSRWTVAELRHQVARKIADLQPLRDGTVPSAAAARILLEGDSLRTALAELDGQAEAPIDLVDRWITLRACTIRGSAA